MTVASEMALNRDPVGLFGCANYRSCKNFVPREQSGWYRFCYEEHLICPPCWDTAGPKCPIANCPSNDRLNKRGDPTYITKWPLYDAIWEGSTFTCLFREKGCQVSGSWKSVEEHAAFECEFRDHFAEPCVLDSYEEKVSLNHKVGKESTQKTTIIREAFVNGRSQEIGKQLESHGSMIHGESFKEAQVISSKQNKRKEFEQDSPTENASDAETVDQSVVDPSDYMDCISSLDDSESEEQEDGKEETANSKNKESCSIS